MSARFGLEIVSKLLANSTKAGAVWAAIQGYQLAERGSVTPEDLAVYLGVPYVAGLGLELLAPLIDKLKSALKPEAKERVSFVRSAIEMIEEHQERGTPDEMTITSVWGDEVSSATWTNTGIKRPTNPQTEDNI